MIILFEDRYVNMKNYRFWKTDMIVHDSRKFNASLTLKIMMHPQHVTIS